MRVYGFSPLRRLPWAALVGALAVSLLALSCASDRPSTYRDGVYESSEASFRVGEPPRGWTRANTPKDGEIAFWNESLGAALAINATCEQYDDMPLTAMANQLVMGVEKRRHLVWEQRPLDGRLGRYMVVEGWLDGVPVKVAAYVLVKDYCTFDLIYHAPPAVFDEGLPALHALADDFSVLRAGRPR